MFTLGALGPAAASLPGLQYLGLNTALSLPKQQAPNTLVEFWSLSPPSSLVHHLVMPSPGSAQEKGPPLSR